jgi:hypothetical protein
VNDPARTLIERLEQAGSRVRGRAGRWMAQCPAHDDRCPSLSIVEFLDGNVWINCFAGCEDERVLDRLGLTYRDLFARPLTDGPGVVPGKPLPPAWAQEIHKLEFAVLDVLLEHAFNGPTCRPSQALIAAELRHKHGWSTTCGARATAHFPATAEAQPTVEPASTEGNIEWLTQDYASRSKLSAAPVRPSPRAKYAPRATRSSPPARLLGCDRQRRRRHPARQVRMDPAARLTKAAGVRTTPTGPAQGRRSAGSSTPPGAGQAHQDPGGTALAQPLYTPAGPPPSPFSPRSLRLRLPAER